MSSNAGVLGRSYSSSSGRSGLLRRLIMLVLFMAGVILWLSVLYESDLDFPFEMLMGFTAVIIGLAGGLGSRLAFGGRTSGLQVAAALAATVGGLLGIGLLTDWRLGIGPVEFWRNRIETLEAMQAGAGALASLLALTAWRRHVRVRGSRRGSRGRTYSSARSEDYTYTPAPRVTASVARPATGTSRRPGVGSLIGRKRGGAVRTPARPVPARRRGGAFRRRRPEVQLSVYEEHKCPYCLEDVKRNDPRGTKECPICHTLHHADCWAVTGMCQVPHLTT